MQMQSIYRSFSEYALVRSSQIARPTLKWTPTQTSYRIKSNELCDVVFAHSNLVTPSDPTLGESQAALQAIKLAVFHNNSYDLFKGNSKGLIEALQYVHSTPP